MSNNTSNNNSKVAAFTGKFEADFETYTNALNDWAAFAGQMETSNQMNKVTARMEYELQNDASRAWVQVFGNTTDVKFLPGKEDKLPNDTRFCSRLNVHYWDERRAQFEIDNPHCDPTAPEYNEIDAANDLEYMNILVNQQEAMLNDKRCRAKLKMLMNMYENVTGKAFVYQPYAVKEQAKATPANAKLGASLLARVKNAGAAEQAA